MPSLSVEVPHSLGQEQAVQRLKQQIEQAKAKPDLPVSNLKDEWTNNNLSFGFSAMGMNVAGTMAVEADRVRVDANLPWAAMMVKGMIEQRLRQELGQVLA